METKEENNRKLKKFKIQVGTIYKFKEKHILIIQKESETEYKGYRVLKVIENSNYKETLFIESIKRYIILDDLLVLSVHDFEEPIFNKGKHLKVSNNEINYIIMKKIQSNFYILSNDTLNSKNSNDLLNKLYFSYWTFDKYNINYVSKVTNKDFEIKQGYIYWCNLGINVKEELNKYRPCIVWKYSKNRKMVTIIPLTSKKYQDNYYFHYDLDILENKSTARIENLSNISIYRIQKPYFYNKKLVKISQLDKSNIIKIIKKYYAFD